jgi:hypothetical protein
MLDFGLTQTLQAHLCDAFTESHESSLHIQRERFDLFSHDLV